MLSRRAPDHSHPENFYEVLLHHCPALIFVKDERYNIVYANDAFLNLYAPEQRADVVGAPSADHFVEMEAKVFNAEDQKAFDEGYSEIVEEITDWRGRQLIIHTRKIRFTDEAGNLRVLGISTDVTKQVAREKMLARSNIALENFAAMAAHDLRSPLASIQSSLELIERDPATRLSGTACKHIALITNCLGGLMDQVANLLSSHKIEEKREDIREECDLPLLFEEVKFNLSKNIENTMAKVLSSELPRLSVNRSMFRQLLHNLIENSLKYRSREKPIVIVRHVLDHGEHCFSVEDNGIGIAPENRDSIFGLYSQLNLESEGAGIGLALCKKIVEMHEGRMWLDEGYKAGCRICFTIPA